VALGVVVAAEGPLSGAVLRLTLGPGLAPGNMSVSRGRVVAQGEALLWQLGDLPAGASARLDLATIAAADLLPEATVSVAAELSVAQAPVAGQSLVLSAPWALLPAAGS
jgi:hypothetical protein